MEVKYRLRPGAGFALVTTLVILALLAIIIISFLASMSSERVVAHASGNAAQSDLAAQSAVHEAMAILCKRFTDYPDSATAWMNVSGTNGDMVTGGTYLFQWDHSNDALPVLSFDSAHSIYRMPLTSGARPPKAIASGDTATLCASPELADFVLVNPSKPFFDPENSVDVNHARFPKDDIGWIGSLPGMPRRAFRAPWVELKESSDPLNAKVVARYAFWVEDESFRVNVNCAKADPRGPDSQGANASEVSLQGLVANGDTQKQDRYDQFAKLVQSTRDSLPGKRLFELRALNQVQPGVADLYKFEGTIFSGALNLARNGAQRLAINNVVNSSPPAATSESETIRWRLDQIIKAITVQYPNFGQRFYRNSGDLNAMDVTPLHQAAYLQKIAANIHDYIDPDSNPTIVSNDPSHNYPVIVGKQTEGAEPLSGASGPINWIAIGKENVPYLQEYGLRANLIDLNPSVVPMPAGNARNHPAGAHYHFTLDYYFEFWNMTNKDIMYSKLGPHPVLRVYNQVGFNTSSGTSIPAGRAFELPIPAPTGSASDYVVFPAGQVTLLTTDADSDFSTLPFLQPGANVIRCVLPEGSDQYRRFQGTTYLCVSGAATDLAGPTLAYRVEMIPRTTADTDYETGMLLENDNGVLESFCALPIARSGAGFAPGLQLKNDHFNNKPTLNNPQYFVRGGSLHGNLGLSGLAVTGDPRTNNEQMSIIRYTSKSDPDETRYFATMDDGKVPKDSTLGLLDTNFVDPTRWFDYTVNQTGQAFAPMVIADAPMKSIGELGHLFDPVRGIGASHNIEYSRGGGRTLTIGQPDPLWDKDPASASHQWAAWRLADIFCTGTSGQIEGSININGVLRDNGAALKAALYGFQFGKKPDSDPALAGQAIDISTVDTLVQQITDRLTGNAQNALGAHALSQGPLFERGELSELPIFAPGPGKLNSVDSSKINDRAREELFRRLVELTTTKGNVFTVYAIGQAIQQTGSGKKIVTGTSQMKVTFRLIPHWNVYAGAFPPITFDPTDTAAVKKRFSPPDSYDVQVLQVSE